MHALQERDGSCSHHDHDCDRDEREQDTEYYAPEDHDAHRDEREGNAGILNFLLANCIYIYLQVPDSQLHRPAWLTAERCHSRPTAALESR